MEEIWKDIEGFEGLYQVSNLGNVRSLNYMRTGKIKNLSPRLHKDGYYQINNLSKNGSSKSFKVHRLVAQAFLPNPNNLPCIDHINTDKTDNRVENLRWVSFHENNSNPLTRQKMAESKKGKTLSEETKQKISDKLKGRVFSDETRQKMADANKGRILSDESRKKISDKLKGKPLSVETIKKMSESRKIKVKQLTLDSELIKIWDSATDAAKELNLYSSSIGACCRGKLQTTGGFKWEYAKGA